MKLSELTAILEPLAPPELAADWDNVGLLAGDPQQTVSRALLTIDLTDTVMAEARTQKADVIMAYHPPIFRPVKTVRPGPNPPEQIYTAVHHHIAVYALHTGFDAVVGGVNDMLAEVVGIENPQPLEPSPPVRDAYVKVIVFVPEEQVDTVAEAMFAAGAGHVGAEGKYSKCSFRSPGTGTFLCGAASHPAIGRPGSYESVAEIKFETLVPTVKLNAVLQAMLAVHPYEEPAYDVVPLMVARPGCGLGRYGPLADTCKAGDLIERIKKKLKVPVVGVIGTSRRRVRLAAVAAGDCGTMLRQVIRYGCDFYLTGELKHHHALELQQAGVTAVCVSHSNSERLALPRLAQKLRRLCPDVTFVTSRKDRDPFTWI